MLADGQVFLLGAENARLKKRNGQLTKSCMVKCTQMMKENRPSLNSVTDWYILMDTHICTHMAAVFIVGFFSLGLFGTCLRKKWGYLKKIRAIDFADRHRVTLIPSGIRIRPG